MSEQETLSERELAEELRTALFSGEPRSVGEALAAADDTQEPEVPEADEDQPVVVEDDFRQREVAEPEVAPELPSEPSAEDEGEIELEELEDANVVWAKKKYGDDPEKWAQAARAQEQHISRIAAENKELQEWQQQAVEYIGNMEQQAQSQSQMGMPLSASEEAWVENSVMNPYQAAQQAAAQNNVTLYNAVIARVAEENPLMAGQIDSQIRMEMQQLAVEQQNGAQYQPPSLAEAMASSIRSLGIDLDTYGEPMSQKIGELGEYDPYVQAILTGTEGERQMALRAVYDLVRTGAMTTRKVRSQERDEQIKHEAELRRQAAGVVTGGPESQPQKGQSPFFQAMEDEWKQRGQWSSEE